MNTSDITNDEADISPCPNQGITQPVDQFSPPAPSNIVSLGGSKIDYSIHMSSKMKLFLESIAYSCLLSSFLACIIS